MINFKIIPISNNFGIKNPQTEKLDRFMNAATKNLLACPSRSSFTKKKWSRGPRDTSISLNRTREIE